MANYNDLDGEVINYHVAYGDGQLYGQPFDEDNFYPMEGYSNLFEGLKKGNDERRKRLAIKQKSKADARVIKAKGKLETAKSKTELAKSQSIAAQGLASASSSMPDLSTLPQLTTETGMSKNTKILIGVGVGVLVIGGVVAYFMLRKKGK